MEILDTPIGDIARDQPNSTRVFLRHKLDFCCAGHRSLREACVKAGLDPAAVVEEIEHATHPHDPVQSWSMCSQAELADHIVDRYHDTLRSDMPVLIAAAHKIERVHADKRDVPAGLGFALEEFWMDLQQHMLKEEHVLFPMLGRGARGSQVYMPVRVMEHDHDEQAIYLKRFRELTHDFKPPAHACATWRGLYNSLEILEQELMQHIHLENNVLFRRASSGR